MFILFDFYGHDTHQLVTVFCGLFLAFQSGYISRTSSPWNANEFLDGLASRQSEVVFCALGMHVCTVCTTEKGSVLVAMVLIFIDVGT